MFRLGCSLLALSMIQCNALSSLTMEWSPTVRVSGATYPGSDPERPQKVNQDAYFTYGEDFIGVMDGHGLKGHLVTKFLESRFPKRLAQYLPVSVPPGDIPAQVPSDVDDTEYENMFARQRADIKDLGLFDDQPMIDTVADGLTDAFLAANLDARIDPAIPTGRSGTTALVAFLLADKDEANLYVAGVGDSTAMLVDDTGAIYDLLPKSTLDIESERRRIERSKGSIVGSNVFFGPVGIAMTRALGDSVMLQAGVVPIPLVERFPLDRARRYCVCLGTDGVFDVLSSNTVAGLIRSSDVLVESSVDDEPDCLKLLVERICGEAKLAWQGDLPLEQRVDDITCVLMLVHF